MREARERERVPSSQSQSLLYLIVMVVLLILYSLTICAHKCNYLINELIQKTLLFTIILSQVSGAYRNGSASHFEMCLGLYLNFDLSIS